MCCCVDCAKYAFALRGADPGAANKSQRCIASASASGRGHFEADMRSDAANLSKMHSRRRQPMVFSGGFGFLDSGIKLEARLRVGD